MQLLGSSVEPNIHHLPRRRQAKSQVEQSDFGRHTDTSSPNVPTLNSEEPVLEIKEDEDGSTYRLIYTVRFPRYLYALHVFQKRVIVVRRRLNQIKKLFSSGYRRQRKTMIRYEQSRITKMTDSMISSDDEIFVGGDNIFADLGLANAEELQAKATVSILIEQLLAEKKLTQKEAAQQMKWTQPEVSLVVRGRLKGFTLERLLQGLLALDQDIDIVIRPKRRLRAGGSLHIAYAGMPQSG